MKIRSILAAFAIIASGSVFAQNATKTEVDKLVSQVNTLSQKVSQLESKATELEATIERVITENVNLVEQLNVKTVTSVTDVNNIQWDIVKVEPNVETNDVVITFRVTNKSGRNHDCGFGFSLGSAIDTDSNLPKNVYDIKNNSSNPSLSSLSSDIPINIQGTVKNVPNTSSYLASVTLNYSGNRTKGTQKALVKFTGVHIPW